MVHGSSSNGADVCSLRFIQAIALPRQDSVVALLPTDFIDIPPEHKSHTVSIYSGFYLHLTQIVQKPADFMVFSELK